MAELLLTADFEVEGLVRHLEVFGERCTDMREPLARCGGYLRGRAKNRIDAEGPGWDALKPATVARKPTVAKIQLLAALFPASRPGRVRLLAAAGRLDVARGRIGVAKTTRSREAAEKRAAHEGETIAMYQQQFGAPAGIRDAAALIAFAQREQRRIKTHGEALRIARAMPLAAGESIRTVHYRNRHGETKAYKVIENASKARRSVRAIGKPRYQVSERSTRLLGGLYDSMHLMVQAKAVVVFSGPSWSGAHNRGATVGHGAHLPKRDFLKIEENDLHTCVAIFDEYLLDAFLS